LTPLPPVVLPSKALLADVEPLLMPALGDWGAHMCQTVRWNGTADLTQRSLPESWIEWYLMTPESSGIKEWKDFHERSRPHPSLD